MDALSTAVSGLNAAALRLKTSAENTANQDTPDYKAKQVEQQAQPNGGVQAKVVEKNPPTITTVNTDGNAQESPNTSQEQEVAEQIVAASSYKANARVVQTTRDLQSSLLDIQA